MGVADALHVHGRSVQQAMLGMIQASAAARGDLSVANNARFELLSLESANLHGFRRWWDRLAYHGVAGYLVRPLYPLRALGLALVIDGLIRMAWRLRAARRERAPDGAAAAGHETPEAAADAPGREKEGSAVMVRSRAGAATLSATKALSALVEGIGEALGAAFRLKPGITVENREQVRAYLVAGVKWLEYFAYKILLALVLLTLANSNPTLRDLIDTVRGGG
jgi:hypothetical protein